MKQANGSGAGVPRELPNLGGATIAARLTGQLMADLREGEFATAARLPAEVELAEHYGVSRSVIRDVLANLEREGFVERGRGVGTIVHRGVVRLGNRLDVKQEYNTLVRAVGCVPSTDSVRLYEEPAAGELAARLEIDKGEGLLTCEKRILASGRPVIYSVDHIPLALFGGSDYRQLDWHRPVFDLLEEVCGVAVDTDIARIAATNATRDIRRKLEVGEDDALIFIDEVGYYKLSVPVLQTYGFYTDFFDFTMLRKKF